MVETALLNLCLSGNPCEENGINCGIGIKGERSRVFQVPTSLFGRCLSTRTVTGSSLVDRGETEISGLVYSI